MRHFESHHETRKHPRIGPLLVRAEFRQKGESRQGYLTNLSVGGAFLATDELLRKGTELSLRIALPWGLGDVSVRAEVVWCSVGAEGDERIPRGAGLAFSRLSPPTEEALRRYMERFFQLAASIEEEPA